MASFAAPDTLARVQSSHHHHSATAWVGRVVRAAFWVWAVGTGIFYAWSSSDANDPVTGGMRTFLFVGAVLALLAAVAAHMAIGRRTLRLAFTLVALSVAAIVVAAVW